MSEQLKLNQPRTNKHAGIIIFFTLALVVIVSNAVSPYFCCYRLIHAIKNQDITATNELVDFPVLKDNLKTRLQAHMAKRFAGDSPLKNNSFAALGIALVGGAVVNQLVDLYVSPAGFQSILQGIKPSRHALNTISIAPDSVPPSSTLPVDQTVEQQPAHNKPDYQMGYSSLNTFDVDVVKTFNHQEHHFKLIMYRSGWYSWKLSDIQLSDVS